MLKNLSLYLFCCMCILGTVWAYITIPYHWLLSSLVASACLTWLWVFVDLNFYILCNKFLRLIEDIQIIYEYAINGELFKEIEDVEY